MKYVQLMMLMITDDDLLALATRAWSTMHTCINTYSKGKLGLYISTFTQSSLQVALEIQK